MKASLELRQQIGQLLIMGFDGTSVTPTLRKMLRELQPAGVILFMRNVESPMQTHALLRDCRKLAGIPLFLCVDMEGGTVDRLKKVLFPAPAAADVFRSGRRENFQRHGRIIGEECRALGFNTDFAPSFDLALSASQGVMGSRAVSADPEQVTTFAREFLRGLAETRVLGCGKHFPGLGAAAVDTHFQLATISKSWDRLNAEDLAPYRGLRQRIAFVMLAHASYPQITGDGLPASLSPHWIKEILRKRIGYRGLVITDDLEMGGILAVATIEEAAIGTLTAGADMFLVCHKEELVRQAFEAVLRKAEASADFAQIVGHAARRVTSYKRRYSVLRRFPPAPSAALIARLKAKIEKFSAAVVGASQSEAAAR
jgi:beta-N-acetylhexosaminidase